MRGAITDLGDYAAGCLELIDRLGLRRPFVAGCSIGGKIALDLACRAPDRRAGVVAMAADARTARGPVGRVLRRELSDGGAPSRSDRTQLGTLATIGRSVSRDRAELIAAMHRREDPAVSVFDLIGWTRHDLRGAARGITCPVHLVDGADDLGLDLASVRWTADQIPGARCTILPGIGHYPMEELEGFGEMLDAWPHELAQVDVR